MHHVTSYMPRPGSEQFTTLLGVSRGDGLFLLDSTTHRETVQLLLERGFVARDDRHGLVPTGLGLHVLLTSRQDRADVGPRTALMYAALEGRVHRAEPLSGWRVGPSDRGAR